MAGSYAHCCENTDDMGRVTDSSGFDWSTIDNMRDAYEACRMMHWMIDYMASHRRKWFQSKIAYVRRAQDCYYTHLMEFRDEEDNDE